MELLLILVSGAVNVACFIIGAKVGQSVSRGEEIKMPSVNPIKAEAERAYRKEAERETKRDAERLNTILRNIENYDGTGVGQEDVPRGVNR
jgi:hypothetical protein